MTLGSSTYLVCSKNSRKCFEYGIQHSDPANLHEPHMVLQLHAEPRICNRTVSG